MGTRDFFCRLSRCGSRAQALAPRAALLLALAGAVCLLPDNGNGQGKGSDQKPVPGNLNVQWIHGAPNPKANKDAPFQVHWYNADTVILRQNMCDNYEAPFLYLLFGQDRAFLLDTGATAGAKQAPLRSIVQDIIKRWQARHQKNPIALTVAHSHSHGDHVAGDGQFFGQPNTTVVGTNLPAVQKFFGITQWPTQIATYDLGGRALKIIPAPGHEETHIAVYDPQTHFLLTGDTLYPGRLYVSNWNAYRSSIERLVTFSQTHPVKYVLGAHIEMMKKPGEDFPSGSTYHPKEHPLPLTLEHLRELHQALKAMGPTPKREIHDDFIIFPLAVGAAPRGVLARLSP